MEEIKNEELIRILVKEVSETEIKSVVLSEDEDVSKVSLQGDDINEVINKTISTVTAIKDFPKVEVYASLPIVDAINRNVVSGIVSKMKVIKEKNLEMINSSDSLIDEENKKILSESVKVIDKLIEKIK